MASADLGCRQFAKDGHWIIPPENRPKGWEAVGLAEPEPDTDIEAQLETPEPALAQTKPELICPVPPEPFGPVFLPILEGIQTGMQARRSLIDLTCYCMTLELWLEERDLLKVQCGGLVESPLPPADVPEGSKR